MDEIRQSYKVWFRVHHRCQHRVSVCSLLDRFQDLLEAAEHGFVLKRDNIANFIISWEILWLISKANFYIFGSLYISWACIEKMTIRVQKLKRVILYQLKFYHVLFFQEHQNLEKLLNKSLSPSKSKMQFKLQSTQFHSAPE